MPEILLMTGMNSLKSTLGLNVINTFTHQKSVISHDQIVVNWGSVGNFGTLRHPSKIRSAVEAARIELIASFLRLKE